MLILRTDTIPAYRCDEPVSPLNVVWSGNIRQTMPLPQLGHLFLICPLADSRIVCANTIVDRDHYLLLTRSPIDIPYTIQNLARDDARLLVILLSPGFIAHMADFLDIPADMGDLLHAVPMLHGDGLSRLLLQLTTAIADYGDTEELLMEVVGEFLRLLRVRHHALLGLANHKRNTISDLLPRLLQARQFIEARYLDPLKTGDVANHIALSEYHFARLFKTAFETTVHQYVIRLRLDRARHLLEVADESITDIALIVGYNSLSAFINAFRKQFGMSPSAYQALFGSAQN